jgi:CPA2 family monovalent cation:H+ antiporter-2
VYDKFDFLADLTVALVAAGLAGAAARRLRLNPVVGYLIAGSVIGPFSPGYIARSGTIEALAELGLIFLLFSLGLGFSPREFRTIGTLALVGNLVLMGTFGGIACAVAVLARLPHPITLAATVVLSSTAVGAALLRQWRIDRAPAGQLAIALLVAQDLAAVALLVFVSEPPSALTLAGIAAPAFRAAAFVAVALVLGATVLHRLVLRLLEHAPGEALVGAFAALALVAAWLGYLAGLSFEFGAFIAGAVVSEAAGSRMVQSIVAPFRTIFVSLFFVSMGMLLDPRAIAAQPIALAALGGTLVVTRFAGWALLARLARIDRSSALLVGAAMVPLGEFNVVLANAAQAASRLSDAEYDLLLGVTFVSIGLATLGGPAANALLRRARQSSGSDGAGERVVVIGFGRVGRAVADVLQRSGIAFTVVESSFASVRGARQLGYPATMGDASDPAVLDRFVGSRTQLVAVTAPETETNAAILRRVRARSAAVVVVRASSVGDLDRLVADGAREAIVPEAEGALAVAAATLAALGTPAEQIDEALAAHRARVRSSAKSPKSPR